MDFTRRNILKNSAFITAFGAIPNVAHAAVRHNLLEPVLMDARDPRVKAICAAAIAAASEAGASYADIRVSHMYLRKVGGLPPETEIMSVGVRALVDGFWGFASSPVWSTDEGARLGRAAVRQAKSGNISGPREINIAPHESVTSGEWIMPVQDDPFQLNMNEIHDFLDSLRPFMTRWPGVSPMSSYAEFRRLDKFFASTLNQEFFQRTYLTSANISFRYEADGKMTVASIDSLTPAGRGFEHIREQDVRGELKRLYEQAKEDLKLPFKPVDVGRYQILIDRSTAAGFMHATLGPATEMDRILGFEANATGTSFINDPIEMIGSLKIASPEVTIIADRSTEGGASTVRWDDEGVQPQAVTLIDKGILTGVQTDRERSGWLNTNLGGRYKPTQSSGSMTCEIAQAPPNIFSGNLSLLPGEDRNTEESMMSEVEDGIFIRGGSVVADFQLSSGILSGSAFEVKKGKRTAMLVSLGVLFKTSELWSTAVKVGGKSSQRTYGFAAAKTNYHASTTASVTASPVLFKEGTVIDTTRKA